ncbi:MAG: NTP transferase domain-containing protein [Anaerolineales bacterium]|nr:NTP transferase domain-containing protein [Anaerolineales bacterium]
MDGNYYAVIMAGGGGTRLWPLSRKGSPKQTLKLAGDRSLFQIAVDRLLGHFPAERILVVTSATLAAHFQLDQPGIPLENYIIEPSGKNTAAAIGLASVNLKMRDPHAVMAIVTADHFIEREGRFLHVLRAAGEVAELGYLVTLGIQPTYPATGFGYIQQGAYLGTFENIVVFQAEGFKEKPDEKTAIEFIAGEDHSWNSGMFIWQVDKIMSEIKRQMPQLDHVLSAIAGAWGAPDYQQVLEKEWETLERVSIDFGIMEGAENVAVIPARGLGWSDVGSWNAVYEVLPKTAEGNVLNCPVHIARETNNTMVFASDQCDRLIVTLGVDNLVVVDTPDVLLICDQEHAQDVRVVVDELKEKGKNQYL